MAAVIDVHTHMYAQGWLSLLRETGGPDYAVKASLDGPDTLHYRGGSFGPLSERHFDYDLRVAAMKEAKVDLAIITLSAPSAFWGEEAVSVAAARIANDDFAAAQRQYPDHIRWMATLPWAYPEAAVAELKRACALGAVGVFTLGNINGRHLVDPLFAPVWQAIDERSLPVLLHPTVPAGAEALELSQFAMNGSIGFMIDTSVAVVRMIHEGFLDRFASLKLIVGHAGATLPYLAGRLDRVYETTNRAKVNISRPPSEYLRAVYYDAVCYRQEALAMCLDVSGPDQLLYGSDYPFNFGDMRGCLGRVDALGAGLRDKVRSGNAIRIFGL
jgi:aminocarboxymuconate-semialdehyde decarboxylase